MRDLASTRRFAEVELHRFEEGGSGRDVRVLVEAVAVLVHKESFPSAVDMELLLLPTRSDFDLVASDIAALDVPLPRFRIRHVRSFAL